MDPSWIEALNVGQTLACLVPHTGSPLFDLVWDSRLRLISRYLPILENI